MNKLAKQLCIIANQLQDLKKEEKIETASKNIQIEASNNQIKTAGFFSKLFAKGMTEQSKKQIDQVIDIMTGNSARTIALIMKGQTKDIQKLLSPLKNTKQTNQYYDSWMEWFKECWDSMPKAVKNKCKDMSTDDLAKALQNDDFLKGIKKQFDDQLNSIKNSVKIIQSISGQADSWQDAFRGWGGFTKAQ